MKIVEELTTTIYDNQEKFVGSASTQILVSSSFWERLEDGWHKSPLWVRTTLSNGVVFDTILQRSENIVEAREEHRSRAWNYRMHLLGEDWL